MLRLREVPVEEALLHGVDEAEGRDPPEFEQTSMLPNKHTPIHVNKQNNSETFKANKPRYFAVSLKGSLIKYA